MDFAKLSIAELDRLKAEIDKCIVNKKAEERQEVLEQIKALASSKGFDLNELLEGKSPIAARATKSARKVAARYRHPSDPTITWTGRGKQPVWVRDMLSQGKSLSDFAIG